MISLWLFHVIIIIIATIIISKAHYVTCDSSSSNSAVPINGDVPYYFVLGDPFKLALEQDAILKKEGPQKYAFLNENKEKLELRRLNNGRVKSTHTNPLRDLKSSNSKQIFQNNQEEDSQKVFIFDTGNHTDRHGFIQVERKKKNILPEESQKVPKAEKKPVIKDKRKKLVKTNANAKNTKLVAASNWAFGLKNGLKNTNRLLWVSYRKNNKSDANRDIPERYTNKGDANRDITDNGASGKDKVALVQEITTERKSHKSAATNKKSNNKNKYEKKEKEKKLIFFRNESPPTVQTTGTILILDL